jgi:hypothetical protein
LEGGKDSQYSLVHSHLLATISLAKEIVASLFCGLLTYLSPLKSINSKPAFMKNKISLSLLVLVLFFFGCRSNEVGSSKDVDPAAIWFDYQVRAEENNSDVTVLLQFRFAGENGTTLALEEPSSVSLDGVPVRGDSSRFAGAYYEIQKSADSFTGKHSIVFTDSKKKQYREDFEFRPVKLLAAIPDTIHRGDLEIKLDGLEMEDFVRVIMTDTAFTSNGINRVDTVKNGRLFISRADLQSVFNGPVQLELVRESENPVKNGTREGGRLSIFYTLKREFILRD